MATIIDKRLHGAMADADLDVWLRREAPINLARAYDIMGERQLDGLVLGDPINVFHLLGYWPQIANTKAGQPPTSFVLLARDERQAPGFVTSRFIYYYTWADSGFTHRLQTWLYEAPGDDDTSAPGGVDNPAPEIAAFPDRAAAPLSAVERRRAAALAGVAPLRRSIRDAGGALVQAMREMGLWRGRIACDDPVIAAVCRHHDHPGVVVPADNIMRAIRLVKSPLEIALMGRASAANVAAVDAVGRSVRAGAGYADLRRIFDIEVAQRGNRPVFLTVDRVSSELADDRVRDGQTLFIDGVSHYRHYHGDYARTVFVGEPAPAARRAAEAAILGWSAVREALRPGLRYSRLVEIGRDAVRKAGFSDIVGFGPHSVGLMHTDEPGEEAGGFYRKADLVLSENMILSVDCPVMDTGIGGSAHLEDLMLITADGAEPIHPVAAGVVTI